MGESNPHNGPRLGKFLFYDILEHEQFNKQRKGMMYAYNLAQALDRTLVPSQRPCCTRSPFATVGRAGAHPRRDVGAAPAARAKAGRARPRRAGGGRAGPQVLQLEEVLRTRQARCRAGAGSIG